MIRLVFGAGLELNVKLAAVPSVTADPPATVIVTLLGATNWCIRFHALFSSLYHALDTFFHAPLTLYHTSSTFFQVPLSLYSIGGI